MAKKQLFLKACDREPVERVPVWLMRQAGRYLPEYLQVRSQAGSFLNLCKTPALATEVTLQPIRRFGLDAAILFSDILVVPEAMGLSLDFLEGEGPVFSDPLRESRDLKRIKRPNVEKKLGYVYNAIEEMRGALPSSVPLIGFAGSPWTLATYMVEGGTTKKFAQIKTALFADPEFLHGLLSALTETVTEYLNGQIDHGAQAIQIFDTWGGILGRENYKNFSLRYMSDIVKNLKRTGPTGKKVPVILFSKGCGPYSQSLAKSGCDVISLDWTADVRKLRKNLGEKVAFQGNMDPAVLYAPEQTLRDQVRKTLKCFGPQPGHIFNLGHGMEPDMNPDRVQLLVDIVREESSQLIKQHGEKG
ncbi:MAG: uroporphyrinogen decarboxylase [Magnetococcales bacterium]|nr:uroporphyrinogen decarboxylase [Magnetococcales bacterium]